MPRRTVLSSSQRTVFEVLPSVPDLLTRYYVLDEDELALISKCRRPRNRLGFALQLCLIKFPGRALRPDDEIPDSLVEFIAEQIEEESEVFCGYADRDQTRREHFKTLIEFFRLSRFGDSHYQEMVRWLTPIAVDNPKSTFLVGATLNELRRRKILHPALTVVERLVAQVKIQADRRVYNEVTGLLSDRHQADLKFWLNPRGEKSQSRLSWIRQPAGRPSPINVILIMEKLAAIRLLGLPSEVLDAVPTIRRKQLAQEGNRIAVHNLRMLNEQRRYTIMTVCLLEIQRSLMDEVVNMHDRIIGSLMRRSQRKQATQLQDDAKNIKTTVNVFSKLGQALIKAREEHLDPWELIEAELSWDDFRATVEAAENLSQPQRFDYLHYVDTSFNQIRRYAPTMLEHFDFRASSGGRDVLTAIDIIRDMNKTGKRKLPDQVPTSFIPKRWQPFIFETDGLNRRYYELCALSELRNRLRSGDVWVPGSRQFEDFNEYLMGPSAFRQLQESREIPVAVETDCTRYISERKELLESQLEEFQRLLRSNDLDTVCLKNGRLSMQPYRGNSVPDEAKQFSRRVYAELPRIKITDLLIEVDQWTGFTEQFTHLRTGQPSQDKESLLSVILSDGINLGLTRMAEASSGASYKQLSWVSDWYVRSECYSRGLAEITNYHHIIPLAGQWGDGSTSSSDGQHFPLGSVGRGLGDVNARYGRDPGVIFYTHISDQYTPFHSQLINATARDATYVLDGLLYHESNLNIEEHYTDTAGFTDHVFALCHLLGFRFAPRIRNIGDVKLYTFGSAKRWADLEPLIGSKIKQKDIENQWEEILRLASSIRLGTVTASLIIRKLASYPRQNKLALAIRELGRLERTLFLLDWVKKPELRSRVQAGLNKGESRNALARAVFFNRLGEVRDRSFESQCYRTSGLNLVVATIILWNTVYLEKAVKKVREEMDVPEEFQSYLSPLGWEHINLTGDYIWNLGQTP
ncbi:Tn3 family transposase [Pseudodesulfovibrio piezophilus]|uniref:Transposase n=1 Tax=Pseudodesulfovibrio piezophilus (strain DSM 21447 / JCM 15486 / C1TLV30) TaxID=1322246 RepID=M1WQU2_PSEP2|nr:Tn3 family transposase [Pseudodesulfovibrio piezophilus]CCH47872.1 transposase [Pseudodesulfovibrio piezophilus C1TLV30]